MNKVVLVGRLTADPEVRATPNGTSVATFRLAVDRRVKSEGQPEADFIPVVVWGKLAENVVGKYCSKGRQVAISGRIQTRTWQSQDGSKHYATEVIAEELNLLAQPGNNTGNAARAHGAPEQIPEADLEGFTDLGFSDESELPF